MEKSPCEIMAEGKYLKLLKQGDWEYVDRTRGIRAVAIIAITPKNELVLTEQYRVPLDGMVFDLPAGLVGDEPGSENEAEELAAHRELVEETGYQATTLLRVISGPTSAGMATEQVTFFLARDVHKVGNGGGVAGESIQVHLVPLNDCTAWLLAQTTKGKLVDVKTFFAAAWLKAECERSSSR
ncbi:NUDIX hydrolase [Planctomicrobium sp. SH668]|uniref:NUDIX hydrolase n=1 Tax=Planctomicrobium sp. SH668 TaxID=3448126 RepID=UPI003F5C5198